MENKWVWSLICFSFLFSVSYVSNGVFPSGDEVINVKEGTTSFRLSKFEKITFFSRLDTFWVYVGKIGGN